MSAPRVVLLHGWGLDASLWNRLVGLLPFGSAECWDRGYFGRRHGGDVEGVALGIGHSLGALLLAGLLPPHVPLVAINGFDHFVGDDAVPARVVDRMRRRFATAPAAVLAGFRARIGAGAPPEAMIAEPLATDLDQLAQTRVTRGERPMLLLDGAEDPLLPAAMRAAAFPGAARATRAGGGHLLPISHAGWCAERIGGFAWG